MSYSWCGSTKNIAKRTRKTRNDFYRRRQTVCETRSCVWIFLSILRSISLIVYRYYAWIGSTLTNVWMKNLSFLAARMYTLILECIGATSHSDVVISLLMSPPSKTTVAVWRVQRKACIHHNLPESELNGIFYDPRLFIICGTRRALNKWWYRFLSHLS